MQGKLDDYQVHCKKCDKYWIDHPSYNIVCPHCNKHLKVTRLDDGLVKYLDNLKIKVGKYDRKKRKSNNSPKTSKNSTPVKSQ